jgi:hypothetical protein
MIKYVLFGNFANIKSTPKAAILYIRQNNGKLTMLDLCVP